MMNVASQQLATWHQLYNFCGHRGRED